MLKRILKWAALHFAACLGLLFVSLMSVDMDDESGASTPAGDAAATAFEVLSQPGIALHESFNSSGHDALEWTLVGVNSLIWGAGLALLVSFMRKPQGPRDTAS